VRSQIDSYVDSTARNREVARVNQRLEDDLEYRLEIVCDRVEFDDGNAVFRIELVKRVERRDAGDIAGA